MRAQTIAAVSSAVVPGSMMLRSSARPTATGTPPSSGTLSTVSVSGGRFSLPAVGWVSAPPALRVAQGARPARNPTLHGTTRRRWVTGVEGWVCRTICGRPNPTYVRRPTSLRALLSNCELRSRSECRILRSRLPLPEKPAPHGERVQEREAVIVGLARGLIHQRQQTCRLG